MLLIVTSLLFSLHAMFTLQAGKGVPPIIASVKRHFLKMCPRLVAVYFSLWLEEAL